MHTDQNELLINMHKRDYWLARATAADKSDKVTVSYPPMSRRMSYTEVKGAREDVLDHVAWLISRDSCTPMYEHMLMSVDKIAEQEGVTVARLSKNLYAGD